MVSEHSATHFSRTEALFMDRCRLVKHMHTCTGKEGEMRHLAEGKVSVCSKFLTLRG